MIIVTGTKRSNVHRGTVVALDARASASRLGAGVRGKAGLLAMFAATLAVPTATHASPAIRPSYAVSRPPKDPPAAAVPHQAWEVMIDRDVELILDDGTSQSGTIAGHDAATVTLIGEGGVVAVHSKHRVVQLRALQNEAPVTSVVEAPRPTEVVERAPPTGRPLVATGAAVTAVGCALFIPAVALAVLTSGSSAILWAPLLVSTITHLGAGIPLLAIGTAQRRRHRRWKEEHRLTVLPGPAPGLTGVTGRLILRF